MVIIFFNAKTHSLYVCSEANGMQVISLNDPDLISSIPNEDILYVQSGHFITKGQFVQWINGQMPELDSSPVQKQGNIPFSAPVATQTQQAVAPQPHRLYIHPTGNGTVLIEDIKTAKYKHGIELNGKWHFIPVDDIGQHVLEQSPFFRSLLKNKKIEIVDNEYVNNNKHKITKQASLSEAALDAILVPAELKAAAVAFGGAWDRGDNDNGVTAFDI